jgi:hypothetical protein
MAKAFLFAAAALVVASLAGDSVSAADSGRWYPFYGYHQPNYMSQPSVVVQPSQPQVSTAYYPPVPSAVAPSQAPAPQYVSPSSCNSGGRWYPFYGYRRPNFN